MEKNHWKDVYINRKSVRDFKDKNVEQDKISQLLWAAYGITNSHRTVPSAGATYPFEIYVLLKGIGLFHYDHNNHKLDQIINRDISYDLAKAVLGQMFINKAPLNLIICADYSRTTRRYGNRGIRYVHMEVGHCAQNIHLQAEVLDLSSVPISAFKDKEVKSVLKLPKNLDPLYIIPIGYPK